VPEDLVAFAVFRLLPFDLADNQVSAIDLALIETLALLFSLWLKQIAQ
jgi:hypothetical protein